MMVSRLSVVARLIAVFVLAVLALIWIGRPVGAVETAPLMGAMNHPYTYDALTYDSPGAEVTSERGPPTACRSCTIYDVGRWSHSASPRSDTSPGRSITTYAYRAALVQVARATTRTGGRAVPIDVDFSSLQPWHVAANTGRVFTSADAHVAGAANAIEAALPGRVVGVNSQRLMPNGLSREVDIDLGNLIVQVKSGNARGITGQIARTQASTGTPTIGYAPGISDAAWRNAASQGTPILRSPTELLAYIREFG